MDPARVIPFPQRPSPEELQEMADLGVGRYVGSAHYYQPQSPQPADPPLPSAVGKVQMDLGTLAIGAVALVLGTALLTYQSPNQAANRQQAEQLQQMANQLSQLQEQNQSQGDLIQATQKTICTAQ